MQLAFAADAHDVLQLLPADVAELPALDESPLRPDVRHGVLDERRGHRVARQRHRLQALFVHDEVAHCKEEEEESAVPC